MASENTSANSNELITRSYPAGESIVIPADEEIVNVSHDRTAGLTTVVTKAAYSEDRAREREEAAAGGVATPQYPQPAGAVSAPAAPPNNHFPWGSIDTTKVQNLEAVKNIPNELMPEGLQPHPVQGITGDPAGLPPDALKEGLDPEDISARSKVSRSPEEAAKQDTIVAGSKAAEGDNPRVGPNQEVDNGEVKQDSVDSSDSGDSSHQDNSDNSAQS